MDGWTAAWMNAWRDEFGGSSGLGRGPSMFNPLFFSPEALRHNRTFSETGGQPVN